MGWWRWPVWARWPGCPAARGLALALLAAVAVHVFVALTYRAPQTVEYLMPAYVLMAVWAAGGMVALAGLGALARLPRRARVALPFAAALAAAWALAGQWQATAASYQALARHDGTRAYAEGVLNAAPPNALVLATWHWATPLWYLQRVEGARPDVEVRYIVPQGQSLARNWAEAIAAEVPRRPVVVTSLYAAEYAALPYPLAPLGPAWQVLAEPLAEAPPNLSGAVRTPALNFLGYRVDEISEQAVTVSAAWQRANSPPATLSFFVHLLGPDGALHSQHDVTHPAAAGRPGEVLLDRYALPLAPDAPTGVYRLVAGAYPPTDPATRLLETELQTIAIERPPALAPAPPRAVALGGAMWLAGVEVSPAGRLRPGQTITVRLPFVAARPLTADYAVSVGLVGPGHAWQVRADGTPAGGAIPTLKWIAGSRVTDTRTLMIPADAVPGPATLTLAVYDSFTQQPLAAFGGEVFEGRLALAEVVVGD